MADVIWTKKAYGQFERAIKYIKKEQGLSYAEMVYNKILQAVKLLENNPTMGAIEPLLTHKKLLYRFLVVWSYKIIYRTDEKKVVISRVFHSSRSPKKLRGINQGESVFLFDFRSDGYLFKKFLQDKQQAQLVQQN